MRRRFRNFFPILLIALAVQIFAPIAACWAAGIAASDPLAAAVICHDGNASGAAPTDQPAPRVRDGCCSICSVLQTGAPVGAPEAAAAVFLRHSPASIVWHDFTPGLAGARFDSSAQARAPPSNS